MIQDYFGEGTKWGARIRYVHEDGARGTAGALALLPEPLSRPIIVMNGDLLTKINFDHFVKFHDERRSPATMSVREYRFTVPYGVIEADGYYLSGVIEKPEHKFFVNAGIYIIGPESLELVPKEGPFDMPDLFARVLQESRERNTPRPAVFPLREYWIDIGRIDDLSQAQREFHELFPEP
jgi:NDP-sugar pyrophosphorylase family protein